ADVFRDSPRGYIQRVALASVGLILLGSCLGHLGLIAIDPAYRPVLLALLLTVRAGDFFMYACGRALGGRPLFPNTSPGRTLWGRAGSLVLTAALGAGLASRLWTGTALDHPGHWIAIGVIIAVSGQLGEIVLSSIKIDLGIKGLGHSLAGRGGVLERCNSVM